MCSVTLAELTAGPAATADPLERARRQDRLQRVEATFEPIPFGVSAARAYGHVYAAARARSRHPRRRLADLLIAAVAAAEGMLLITRNPDAFVGLEASFLCSVCDACRRWFRLGPSGQLNHLGRARRARPSRRRRS
ncbi:PIN domain-containing protein [uncultured Tessaracoccus sp.]|uniref:PIN domain-containing protein n=1 Tax=uncultured Tessaracoccus sp. TaxID=905023 RepID=UPI0034475CA1